MIKNVPWARHEARRKVITLRRSKVDSTRTLASLIHHLEVLYKTGKKTQMRGFINAGNFGSQVCDIDHVWIKKGGHFLSMAAS